MPMLPRKTMGILRRPLLMYWILAIWLIISPMLSSTTALVLPFGALTIYFHNEAFIQMKDSLFDADGGIGPDSREFVQGWMDRYVAWVKRHAGN